ncbi:MAG: hypothetical protein IT372_13335, partial [Polyangiaceae bacterium]|nr:hypothetical protein [Polyangiaceae bacterium]
MPGRRVGEYELRSVITTGPWGGVYEAEHPAFGRVALEVLAARFGRLPEQARRFREGGERLAGRRDEAIQRVLEGGYGGERHFIAREPLLGEPASRLLAERGPFEPAEAFRIAMRVAGALEVTHRAGLRHGAVRPSNLILDIARDRVTLVGFLFALPDVSPESGLAADASWYVAPEELRWGRPGDARGDVYALALVTFELCAGQNPFRGELGDMVRKKLATPPPSLCALRSDVPPVADQILGQALSPDPEHRFASAAAFAQALRHAFRAAPPQPPPRRATPAPLPPQAAPYQQRSGTP